MKIVVAVKQVPSRESAPRPSADGVHLDTAELTFEMNEPDAYALEEALQLREAQGGEVVVVSLGPESAAQTIREALAKGADRGIHIKLPGNDAAPPLATAQLLQQAVADEKPDLVLTGLQSDDLGYGQTGVILAELLGYAHATIVMEVTPQGDTVRVKRELEGGWYQYVTLPLPAVLTIQSGIKKLRYATLMGIKKAKTKEVKVIEGAKPAETAWSAVHQPAGVKSTQLMTGDPAQIAQQLVEKLRFEARVL